VNAGPQASQHLDEHPFIGRFTRFFRRKGGDPAQAIFGTVIAAVVLATKAHVGESGGGVIWSAVLALALYWLAHVYADVIGERVITHTRPGWRPIIRAALRDWTMLRASLVPVLVCEGVRLVGGSVNTAVLVALWTTVALLAVWGYIAASRGGAKGWELAIETLVCAGFGLLIVLLKIAVH
jgi:hypothetical protein